MTYRESIVESMSRIAADPRNIFVGYGLRRGRAMGTIPIYGAHIRETTVAENLMVGLATGLSIAGRLPLVYFERFDFVLNALDAIVNHLDKIGQISAGRYCPGVILRVTVGNRRKPLFTGPTHTQDFSAAIRSMVGFPVHELVQPTEVIDHYISAIERQSQGRSTMLIEYKDLI